MHRKDLREKWKTSGMGKCKSKGTVHRTKSGKKIRSSETEVVLLEMKHKGADFQIK